MESQTRALRVALVEDVVKRVPAGLLGLAPVPVEAATARGAAKVECQQRL